MDFLGLDTFLLNALSEDIGTGDITTECCISDDATSKGAFRAKQNGVFCGFDVLIRVFSLVDRRVAVTPLVHDGECIEKGQEIAIIEGPSKSVLSGERVALNIIQHMSGIATATYNAVQAISGTGAIIVDTRKTTPGMRVLEKYAVKAGGGNNHRFNLADGGPYKGQSYCRCWWGLKTRVNAVRRTAPHTLRIEVEVENLQQIKECLESGVDIIMLDNMSIELMAEAVKLINGRALTEASGNMGERDLRAVAETGVNYISIGALTHSVTALDISLKFSD